jgi:hypothetical protein
MRAIFLELLLSEDELDIFVIPAPDVHHNHEFMNRPWNHGCLLILAKLLHYSFPRNTIPSGAMEI